MGTSHLIIFTSSETSLTRLIWNLNQIRDTARRVHVYICQINICQSDFFSCKQQTATFFGCPILLLGFHTFFFCDVVTYFLRLSHFILRLAYVLFCGVVTYFLWLSHFTFRLANVLFCGVVTYILRLSHFILRLAYVLFCGVVTYFLRLSHLTFRLAYVLFCGVVTYFLRLSQLTFRLAYVLFFAVSCSFFLRCHTNISP